MIGRGVYACVAMIAGNETKFRRCLAGGTQSEAMEAYGDVTAQLQKQPPGSKIQYRSKTVFENQENGTGRLVANFSTTYDENRHQGAVHERQLCSVAHFWNRSSGGHWLLDGEQTRQDWRMSRGR